MVDVVDAATRSRIMSRIRGKKTKPEVGLRKALYARGVRFRIHNRRVPGRPDISHSGSKVAVFVDGCFWHGCPRHYRVPKSRVEFWAKKLAYNHDLRARVKAKLDGWHVVEAWECEIRDDIDGVAERIAESMMPG